MLVGDLVYSDDFDCNCNYDIYDCTEAGKQYGDGAELIFSTKRNGFRKPLDRILDMKIIYYNPGFHYCNRSNALNRY